MADNIIGTTKDVAINTVGNFTMGGTSADVKSVGAQNNPAEIVKEMNPTDEEKLLQQIQQRFTDSSAFLKNFHSKCDDNYKMYRAYREEAEKKWVSNIFLPTAFVVIETLLPRVMGMIFGKRPALRIVARKKSDVGFVNLLTALVKQQFHRAKAFREFYLWFKSCFMYGFGVLKVSWKYDVKRQKVNTAKYVSFLGVNIKIGTQRVEKDVVRYDDPIYENVDIYDFFFDPRATNIENAKYVIHRVWRDYDYLYERSIPPAKGVKPLYKNIDKITVGAASGIDTDTSVRDTVGGATRTSQDDNNKIEIWEYWEDNKLVVVANRTIIIRNETENPFDHGRKPFILIKDTELPNEFIPIGEIEPIRDLILERNEIRNQRLDNVKNQVNKKYLVNRNADMDIENLDEDNRPGGIILTDDINNSMKALDESDIIASAYNEDSAIARDVQEASAMSDITTGTLPRRAETATLTNRVAEASASRFSLKIQSIIENGVVEVIKMTLENDRQFIDEKRLVRMYGKKGEEWRELNPEEITMEYDYEILAGMMQYNKEVEKQQWLALISTPIMQAPNINFEAVQTETFELFDVEAPERFVNEMTPEMAQQFAGVAGVQQGVPSTPGVGVPATANAKGIPNGR